MINKLRQLHSLYVVKTNIAPYSAEAWSDLRAENNMLRKILHNMVLEQDILVSNLWKLLEGLK